MKNGKVKKSETQKAEILSYDQVFGNGTDGIPPEIQAEFNEKGWQARWLSKRHLVEGMGVHNKGWEVYRLEGFKRAKTDWANGIAPDGTIVRGDRVLGYKTKEKAELHRKFVKQSGEIQRGSLQEKNGTLFEAGFTNEE